MDMEPPLDNFIKTEFYISFNYLKELEYYVIDIIVQKI